jgi:AraC-like DNA-binding protein
MNMKINIIKKILLIGAMTALSMSCSDKMPSRVIGPWEILYRQDPGLEIAQQAKEWKPAEIPVRLYLDYPPINGFQYVWLRSTFTINEDTSLFYGISMGRVFYTDRVFLNGHLIGENSPHDISILPIRRNYKIPHGILRKGKNEIYIHLGTFSNEVAGISSPVSLRQKKSFQAITLITDFIFIHLPFELVTISFLILFILIIFYLWNRKEWLYLYSSFAVLFYIIFVASLYFPYSDVSISVVKFIHHSAIQFFSLALILIIQSMYGVFIADINWRAIPPVLGAILIILISSIYFKEEPVITTYIGDSLGVANLAIMTPLYLYLIRRLDQIKPDRFRLHMMRIISLGGVSIAAIELVLSFTGSRLVLMLVTFCSPFFLLLFVLFFAREVMKKNLQLEAIYGNLKKTDAAANKNNINETTREKLDRIIQFIKDNYTSDLSREGLASAIDMNPNYMSSLFKTYTGSKINEYINNLRIEEAVRMLNDNDTKIIEIAYAVGFESLSTFNRVFKYIKGKTPTEYREELAASVR